MVHSWQQQVLYKQVVLDIMASGKTQVPVDPCPFDVVSPRLVLVSEGQLDIEVDFETYQNEKLY